MRKRSIAVAMIVGIALSLVGVPSVSAQGDNTAASTGCDRNYVSKSGHVVTVKPTGVDDTANFVCALGEASASGRTVALTAGTFHLDFLFVEQFDGAIRGAGADQTIIEPLAGGLDCVSIFQQFGFVFWLVFVDSNPAISDLRLSIPDVACVEPWLEETAIDEETGEVIVDPETGETVGFSAQDFNAMVLVATRPPDPTDRCGLDFHNSLNVQRVHVDAPQPDFLAPVFQPQGAFSAFQVVGTTPVGCDAPDNVIGMVMVADSFATGVGNLAQIQGVKNSKIWIERNHIVGADASVILVANPRSHAFVGENRIEGGTGVGVVHDSCGGPTAAACVTGWARVGIEDNHIHMSEIGGPGVVLVEHGHGEARPVTTETVRNNTISGEGNFAGVILDFVRGATVARNSISGAMVFGMLVEGPSKENRISDNDLSGLTSFDQDILLTPDTSWNFGGRNVGALILDLGFNNNVRGDGFADPPAAEGAGLRSSVGAGDPTAAATYWAARS